MTEITVRGFLGEYTVNGVTGRFKTTKTGQFTRIYYLAYVGAPAVLVGSVCHSGIHKSGSLGAPNKNIFSNIHDDIRKFVINNRLLPMEDN